MLGDEECSLANRSALSLSMLFSATFSICFVVTLRALAPREAMLLSECCEEREECLVWREIAGSSGVDLGY